jgi:hypothetical protein
MMNTVSTQHPICFVPSSEDSPWSRHRGELMTQAEPIIETIPAAILTGKGRG